MDEARQRLADQQRHMLVGLVENTLKQPEICDYSPTLLQKAIQGQHAKNLHTKVAFYFPTLSSCGVITDADVTAFGPWNPTAATYEDYLEALYLRLKVWADTQVHPSVWLDMMRLERAEFHARSTQVEDMPALVAAARTLPAVPELDGEGTLNAGPLQLVRLTTTVVDVWKNSTFAYADARPFGPPRLRVLFVHPSTGDVVRLPFTSGTDLALQLCFSL